MSPPLALSQDLTPEHNPFVGEIADRLLRSFRAGPVDAGRLALIERVLAFAASAEQQLTEQKQRIAQLESLSMTDELTGLANRRGFHDFLRRTLASARRHAESGVMAYVDLDYFKEINDRFGHDAGDAALLHVGGILADQIRLSDFAARLHGDEFAVLLVRASPMQGAARARHLQRIINASTLSYRGQVIPVQASFGIAAYGPEGEPSELLRRADRAMYEEKRARIRVTLPSSAAE